MGGTVGWVGGVGRVQVPGGGYRGREWGVRGTGVGAYRGTGWVEEGCTVGGVKLPGGGGREASTSLSRARKARPSMPLYTTPCASLPRPGVIDSGGWPAIVSGCVHS